MGTTLRHRSVLCCTFPPQDRDQDVWNRDKAWLRAQLCPTVDPVGHVELHTRAVLRLFPLPRPFSSTWRTSVNTELTWALSTPRVPNGRSRVPCSVTIIKHRVKQPKKGNFT